MLRIKYLVLEICHAQCLIYSCKRAVLIVLIKEKVYQMSAKKLMDKYWFLNVSLKLVHSSSGR